MGNKPNPNCMPQLEQGMLQSPSFPPWLTNSPEEVSILGKSHKWLRQLP